MKIGVIDIGTNTFNLLIKDKRGKVVFNDKIPVKLGKGGINENKIAPDAFERGINALQRYRDICKVKDTEQVFAFATSAVRSATNGAEFVAAVAEQCGIQINVIDGNREALFIYEGVAQAIKMEDSPSLIMDIGGGSTELVIANKDGVLWEASYPLGVSRLLEKFKPEDPLTKADIEAINGHFNTTLKDALKQVAKHKPVRMIGSSGSFETLYQMCAQRFNLPALTPSQASSRIYLHHLNIISEHLFESTLTERLVMPGMLAMRADTIHISALQVQFMLQKTGIKELQLSLYALKEGVIASLENSQESWLISSL